MPNLYDLLKSLNPDTRVIIENTERSAGMWLNDTPNYEGQREVLAVSRKEHKYYTAFKVILGK